MSRMAIRYQCWEVSGPTVSYKLPHGQTHGLVAPQYASDGSTLRRHSNSPHESSFPHFAMYLQPQSDLKGQSLATHPKDVSAVANVRLVTPPHNQFSPTSSSPIASPKTFDLVSEACINIPTKEPAVSETLATTSSVTTESEVKICKLGSFVTSTDGLCEAQSSRLEGISASPSSGYLSRFDGYHLGHRDLRAKLPSSKPGVVERVLPLNGGYLTGGYAHCPPSNDDLPANSSESSSSICQASEDSSACTSEDAGSEEAQSAYRGPLNSSLAALDESLPIKRPGLSKFFGGKSRSFSSLAEVSSVADLAKPNNPYAYIKRRKMGLNCPLDRHRSYPPPTRSSGASIAKKLPSSSSKSSLAVAVLLEQQEQHDHQEHKEQREQQQQEQRAQESQQQEQLLAAAPSSMRRSDARVFPSRSFSLTDLHASGSPPLRRAFVRP
ncbi:uncharacterized protein [Physcomitrium patens]|uniref:Uncharacterized protein n=1 Tax=Physcomitrium patens TaxID=3218 RepID=A0A2K1K3J4_PHYPA|nr:forkhead box protein O-like [Physcomitrium patens]PNR48337.1 hypothetical protein PHYPA_012813 [Physcomitrium patens]|eukprot:XP_024384302.1 forkhead box protein O-like [Physcomitrella patens]